MSIEIDTLYEFDGVIYRVYGTEELHCQLQTDDDFCFQYLSANLNAFEIVSVSVDDSNGNPSNQNEQEKENQKDEFSWSKKTTLLLLNSIRERKGMLRDPKIKKKTNLAGN
ncbi:uncharacterized protein LOC126891465 [Diabrotica virgifera virgifera]|uniref:Uncharacterized protein n=1 Tax=Diabrotica virgifera virgifera TaxID=50390 RepID=A0ABM5L2C9_DIAVI|nr:uncharacterized protein LOC126891465 [Diabrotica virgifera virgifera]